MIRPILIVGTVAAALAAAGSVAAQTKWDMPTPYPDGNFHTQNVRWFADEVKKATNGGLEIVVHANASLVQHPQILRAVQTAQVPAGEILLSQFGNEDPFFEIDAIPFFATGYANARKLYKVQKSYVESRMLKRGIRVLYSVPWPGQAIYTKAPLNALADLKGVKFRTYNPSTSKLATLAGAVPTTVQVPEVPQAFATNIITAMITSAATGIDTKAWEYAKFYYDTKAFHPRNVVMVNEAAFQGLTEDQRTAVLKIAAQAEERGWTAAEERETSAVKTLGEKGMQVVQPSDAIMAEFRKLGATMVDEWQVKAGADGKTLVDAFRQ